MRYVYLAIIAKFAPQDKDKSCPPTSQGRATLGLPSLNRVGQNQPPTLHRAGESKVPPLERAVYNKPLTLNRAGQNQVLPLHSSCKYQVPPSTN